MAFSICLSGLNLETTSIVSSRSDFEETNNFLNLFISTGGFRTIGSVLLYNCFIDSLLYSELVSITVLSSVKSYSARTFESNLSIILSPLLKLFASLVFMNLHRNLLYTPILKIIRNKGKLKVLINLCFFSYQWIVINRTVKV